MKVKHSFSEKKTTLFDLKMYTRAMSALLLRIRVPTSQKVTKLGFLGLISKGQKGKCHYQDQIWEWASKSSVGHLTRKSGEI